MKDPGLKMGPPLLEADFTRFFVLAKYPNMYLEGGRYERHRSLPRVRRTKANKNDFQVNKIRIYYILFLSSYRF